MAIWQIKDFEGTPVMIGGVPTMLASGSFLVDADGGIVEIDVRIEYGPRYGETIRLSEKNVINPPPNPFFVAIRAGLELVFKRELLELRQEIENATENSHRFEAV